MAKNTAQQGASFERRTIADLEQYGYTCIRSAASKGAVDIVAVAPLPSGWVEDAWWEEHPPLLFVQCKLSNPQISPAERTALNDLALRAGAVPVVAWWAKSETTGLKAVHYRRLTGDGPKDWVPWAPGEDD